MKKLVLFFMLLGSPMAMYFYAGASFMYALGLLTTGSPVGLVFLAIMVILLWLARRGLAGMIRMSLTMGERVGVEFCVRKIREKIAEEERDEEDNPSVSSN